MREVMMRKALRMKALRMREATTHREARAHEVGEKWLRSGLAGTTPVPNWLLDEAMPLLSDTQLRVLLVVVRSTLGWQEGRGRRERDWLSHRQLQTRTGRSSAVVSRAVDGLVRRGLVAVTDAAGHPLLTATARSRSDGRLFYRLTAKQKTVEALQNGAKESVEERVFTLAALAESTLESKIGMDSDVPLNHLPSASESKARRLDVTCETVPQKLRTTKETGTKESKQEGTEKVVVLRVPTLQNEVSRFDLSTLPGKGCDEMGAGKLGLMDLENDGQDSTLPTEELERNPVELVHRVQSLGGEAEAEGNLSLEMQRVITAFLRLYRSFKPGQEVPPLRQEDYDLLTRRLRQYRVEELEAWLPQFFACTFGYVRRRGWSLGSYLESLTLLRAAQASARIIPVGASSPETRAYDQQPNSEIG